MPHRTKWNLVSPEPRADLPAYASGARALSQLLETGAFSSHFQPIFSTLDGSVYACEALARVDSHFSPHGPAPIFAAAREHGMVAELDRLCCRTALHCAAAQGVAARAERLFLNVCPQTLMAPGGWPVAELVDASGLSRSQIVIELTEQDAVCDYELFARAVAFTREQGFQIAIDDFGVGYGGLKMLAVIEPDFVKIDRHFVRDIERAVVRRNLVDSIATACHRLGIKVVAEGVESASESEVLLGMGIEYLQGFGLARPSAIWPAPGVVTDLPRSVSARGGVDEAHFIGDIAAPVPTLAPGALMAQARLLFINHPALMSLPVVEGERCIGMLQRKAFFENQLSGPFGYGTALSTYKTVFELSRGAEFICVEANETLEDVASQLNARHLEMRYDDVCVASNGKYVGTVAISALLEAMTQRSLLLARGANPLSGLPGNEAIRREIEKRIAQMMHFDACYIDIDNFKPFNDCYGFARGDEALRHLSNVIREAVQTWGAADDFAGHIGGDDFLLLTRPAHSVEVCRAIIEGFESALPSLHGDRSCYAGGFEAVNRAGERECFPLLALSIGVVSTEVQFFGSVAELSSVASEVKKAAKARAGSSLVRDRRLLESGVLAA